MKHKNIFITGAANGIGRSLALLYISKGAKVFAADFDFQGLESLAKEANAGNKFEFAKCDVSQFDEMDLAVETAFNSFGKIDAAVLCAGIGDNKYVKTLNTDYLHHIFSVNFFGIANGLESLAKRMKKQGFGVIAGIGSIVDVRGYPGSPSYSSSKAALASLLESTRILLGQFGVRIVKIRFSFIKTRITETNDFAMPFMASSEKAAEVIIKGIESGKKVIEYHPFWVIVANIVKLLPNFIYDRIAAKVLRGENVKYEF